MKIVIASSNKGKIKEIERLLPDFEVVPFSSILGDTDIEETGTTFQENSIIKAKTVNNMLKAKNYSYDIVLADDSGITVPDINNEPNIYSARYAGVGATDKENNQKLISKLQEKSILKTKAYYTAAIAIVYKDNIYTTHGWMYGDVIDTPKGDKGFGYDPLFIPNGYDKTLGELDDDIKKSISHRSKALDLAKIVIKSLIK